MPILKIRQSYHGTGGKEGYRFELYNKKDRKIGELIDFPARCEIGDVVEFDGELYIKTAEYDSNNPRHEKTEVMFHELKPYEFKPKFNLE